MPSTTALFTGLSGLTANSRNIDVIGNNIANVNTTAYKSNRLLFSTVFSRNFSLGSSPSTVSGGTNPFQVGLGVRIAGTQRNTTAGSVTATGDSRDLAIDGAGYFVVDHSGTEMYTRAGAFRPNQNNDLVDISGNRLKGFAVDQSFNIIPGKLVDLNVPVGSLTLAQATTKLNFSGNLNSDGHLPTQGARLSLMGTATTGLHAISTAAPPPNPGDVLETNTRLVDIEDPALPASNTPLFTVGQVIELNGAQKGSKVIPKATLTVTATTTVQDLNTFLTQAIGIDTTNGNNPDGRTPGLSLDPVTGTITMDGNTGTANDLTIATGDIRLLSSTGAFIRSPFSMSKANSADGESVRTTFVAYDSLGSPVDVDLTMVLDSKTSAGTTWRYYADSGDDSDVALQVGAGRISFDTQGQPTSTAPISITVDRANTGAATPLTLDLNLSGSGSGVTSLSDTGSSLSATSRDGAPIGTLASFAVGADGVISGSFTNGLTRTIGQVALATFSNPEGLVDSGNSLFSAGANSGTPTVSGPGTFGAGQIVGGALELSNVDLGEEFIKLILSSTGYSASSRVIKTTDDLMQQLLVLGR
jgi:flagellar hook protein FlgE